MHKSFLIGTAEKHQIDFRLNWFTGLCVFSCDGKVLFRRPFAIKIDRVFEIGIREKHIVHVRLDLFDYYRDFFYLAVDGQRPAAEKEILAGKVKVETAVDDAASALIFVASVNVILAAAGALWMPDAGTAAERLMLLLAGMVYLFLGVNIALYRLSALLAGTFIFLADSVYGLLTDFSWAGLVVRALILFYLLLGLAEFRLQRKPRSV